MVARRRAGGASQITRWREVGIGIHDADRAAVNLGYAPHQIWGWDTWLNVGFAHCPHADGEMEAA